MRNLLFRKMAIAAIVMLACFSTLNAEAGNMFLRLDPIKGDSDVDTHINEIVILGWNWGASQPMNGDPGRGGRGASRADLGEMMIIKRIDKSTPDILLFLLKGTHIAKAEIKVRREIAGADPLDYIIITMEDVILRSVSHGGRDGEGMFIENVALVYNKIGYVYYPQNPDGTVGPPVSFKWNLETNQQE